MWHIPPEVNLGRNELAVFYRVDLAIAKCLPARRVRFIHDEGLISHFPFIDAVEPDDSCAVRPTNLKICRAIQRIVQWAGEMKVLIEQSLHSGEVSVDIGLQASASNVKWGGTHRDRAAIRGPRRTPRWYKFVPPGEVKRSCSERNFQITFASKAGF